jgi:adenylate cyclase
MVEIDGLLRRAELDAEKLSALIRLAVFAALAAAILSAERSYSRDTMPELAIVLYGIGTAVGLALAWRRVFQPSVPYLFVTFDVILVSVLILMLSGMMGMATSFAFALPVAGLIFIILIHASLRYRPWLIAYGATLFLVVVHVGTLFSAGDDHGAMGRMRAMEGSMAMPSQGMGATMNFEVLPVTLVILAAFLLFVSSQRTRRLLLQSIDQSVRVTKLSRYFSPEVAENLAVGDDQQLLKGRRQSAAVLFVDIRGFTSMGEDMAPEQLSNFLSEYRNRLTVPIFKHGGTVDKFIGDAIMAVFGTPISHADDARRAVLCGLEMLEATARWTEERARSQMPPVAVGIGAHYGEVFAGALGNAHLLEFTVIGDTVNVAERLERLSREVDSPLVVSAALLDEVDDADQIADWRRLPPKEVKGHRQPVEASCLVAPRNVEP